jgi:hypothetical protein
LKKLYMADKKTPQWLALAEFFRNPWFRRVWIVQEVASTTELHLLYGNSCIDWENVARAVAVLADRVMLDSFRPPEESYFNDLYRDVIIGLMNADIMLEVRGDVDYKRPLTLSLVLMQCVGFKSSDPKDKVYALLGLTNDDSKQSIVPDYSDSNNERLVYIDTMRYLLRQRIDQLDSLSYAGIGYHRETQNLPSWVPDWSSSARAQYAYPIYSAGRGQETGIAFDPADPCVVELDGLQFDSIKTLGPVHEIDGSKNMSEGNALQRQWFARAEELAREAAEDLYHHTGEPVMEAFTRTLLGNRASYSGPRPSAAQCTSDYEALKHHFTTFDLVMKIKRLLQCYEEYRDRVHRTRWLLRFMGHVIDPEVYRFLKSSLQAAVWDTELTEEHLIERYGLRKAIDTAPQASKFLHFAGHVVGRRFCITEQGRMAIVPPFSREADMICIINGARTPYVLRKTADCARLYELIGCCYVHGVMEGEIKVHQAQTFRLV